CGFAKDALQKISDAPLTDCPACGKSTFKKQLTAAGFQLKGTGWYATDFKSGGTSTTSAPAVAEPTAATNSADSTSSASGTDSATPAKTESSPPAST
ncbi:MAG: zinc ribbon domain-containing protein, partial [Proteobacteria bacterium]|nr:zinc ribbon domain-containing protein [Pseudomonadota bacterium]